MMPDLPMNAIFEERRYLIPFRSILLPQIFTDTLVIGSGAAGMSAALSAAGHGDVILVTKDGLETSNSAWAQGGIAAVLDPADDLEKHVQDTLVAGAGLSDENVTRQVIGRAPAVMQRLLESGFRADRDEQGRIDLGREGGHSERRIVHSEGDATGRELVRCLFSRVREQAQIRIFQDCFTLDLITPTLEPGMPCMGAVTHHPKFGLQIVWARATILASGGAGAVWRETTNPPTATADGLAMAFRAGATVADLEFMQFHPTTLYVAGANRLLISEAVRGEGAKLVDLNGHRFMMDEHPLAELAPRDIVSRAIHRQVARSGAESVYLDATGISDFATRFPGIWQTLRQFDLNPAEDLIPVNPAAHYLVGGVRTDAFGRTDVPGLYAVGEVASTGLHGANRLASNSLLEALVVGEMAGETSQEMLLPASSDNAWGIAPRLGPIQVISDIPISQHGELDLSDVRSSLRSATWRNVGIERIGAKLDDVADMCDFWARYTLDKIFDHPPGWETQNMLLVGALVTRSAERRRESRGCHLRTDYPEPDNRWQVHQLWRRQEAEPRLVPVGTAPTAR